MLGKEPNGKNNCDHYNEALTKEVPWVVHYHIGSFEIVSAPSRHPPNSPSPTKDSKITTEVEQVTYSFLGVIIKR